METENQFRKAVLGRYLPASGAVLLTVLSVMAIADPDDISWMTVGVAGAEVACMTLGFGSVMALIRKKLTQIPRLGLRSAAAGLLSPLILMLSSWFAQGATTATIAVLSMGAGVVAGAGLAASSALRRPAVAVAIDPAVTAELERLEAELKDRLIPPGSPAVAVQTSRELERVTRG